MKPKESTIYTIGRRKEALAKVRLSKGAGKIIINDMQAAEYFPGLTLQRIYQHPLEITKTSGMYDINIKIEGGGKMSQLRAVVHGISKALASSDLNLRKILKKDGLLTRDARVKERRKYGHAQKARAMKQSPKR